MHKSHYPIFTDSFYTLVIFKLKFGIGYLLQTIQINFSAVSFISASSLYKFLTLCNSIVILFLFWLTIYDNNYSTSLSKTEITGDYLGSGSKSSVIMSESTSSSSYFIAWLGVLWGTYF